MPLTLTEKIIQSHIEGGALPEAGKPAALRIDQTLTQDATGTMAYLQFEGMGKERVQTELSVSYVDHNTLQEDFKNADDHRYLQTAAARYGLYFSRPGNGICHQIHLEKFGVPGKTLLGSDSHTPTGGALAMLAIGAGGLDVAVAMAGGPFTLLMPKVYGVRLSGRLSAGVSAKDVILELLRRETVKGGAGAVYEYFGEGVAGLSVTERATITNMGAELGATSSLFPSDGVTRAYLGAMGRERDWRELAACENARYAKVIEIDLSSLTPLAACPHSPDNVRPVAELAGLPVDQVVIGSCTNSSLADLAAVAAIVDGKTVHPRVSAGLACGSRAVLLAAQEAGILACLARAGFRLLECACGPCIGMGFAPKSGGISLRTFNRNFKGRSGTLDAGVYLVSPQTAAAAAIAGCFTPDTTGQQAADITQQAADTGQRAAAISQQAAAITQQAAAISQRAAGGGRPAAGEKIAVSCSLAAGRDNLIIAPLPLEEALRVPIERGPNIKPCPRFTPPEDTMNLAVLIKTGDNISTDDIMPAGAKVLPFRSNIPEIAKYVFTALDSGFYARAKEAGAGVIVGGENYGQGSSREHAALAPAYLGVKAVIVKSFARIHKANLINYGILPFVFARPQDYDRLEQGDTLELSGIHAMLAAAGKPAGNVGLTAGNVTLTADNAGLTAENTVLTAVNARSGERYEVILAADAADRRILRAGGRIAEMRGA